MAGRVSASKRQSTRLWHLLYLISGVCSLCYQLIWVRQLQTVVGSTIGALSIVTALFMGGLSIGSYVGGRISGRIANRFAAYAAIEACTTICAVAACAAIPASAGLYAHMASSVGRALPMILLPLLTVTPAATLMGMSMPLLAQAIMNRSDAPGVPASRLYVINTVGALVGAGVVGFAAIRALGVTATWVLAASLNGTVALVAFAAGRSDNTVVGERIAAGAGIDYGGDPGISRPGLLAAFVVSGFLSFGYEIYWARSLVTIMGNSTYAVASILTTTLGGLVVGSWLASKNLARIRRPVRVLGLLELGIGLSALVVLPVLITLLYRDGVQSYFFTARGSWLGQTALRFGLAAATLLLPSILNGATLPLMIRVMSRRYETTGRDLGITYAADAAGNVSGTVIPAFILIPAAGITRGIALLAAMNLALGVFYLSSRRRRWVAAPAAAALVTMMLAAPLAFRFPSDTRGPFDAVLYYREGAEAITTVYQRQDTGDVHMSVDGVFIGGTGDSARKEYVLAHLHAALHPEPAQALTVGLGSGILAAELAKHDGLQRIDVIEIASTVVEGASAVSEWREVSGSDARLSVVVNDALNELMTMKHSYDVIISDGKSRPTSRANGLPFTADYYRLLSSRLSTGGIVLQWVALNIASADFRTVLRTFADAFPHAMLWWLPDSDAFLIGSDAPIDVLAKGSGDLHTLGAYGVHDLRDVRAMLVADRELMLEMAGDGPVNTLDRPVVEFYRISDYARPASALVASNLSLLAEAGRRHAAVRSESDGLGPTADDDPIAAAFALAALLADAYAGHRSAEELDAEALELAGRARPVDWALSNYFVTRAAGAFRRGDLEGALRYADRASGLHQNPRAAHYASLAHAAGGTLPDAVSALRSAVAGAPEVPLYRNTLARLLIRQGNSDAARDQYEKVLAVMPGNVTALQSLGVLLAAEGTPGRSEELLRTAYSIAPASPDVVDSLSWMLHVTGRTGEAQAIVRRSGSYADGRPDLMERREEILRAR